MGGLNNLEVDQNVNEEEVIEFDDSEHVNPNDVEELRQEELEEEYLRTHDFLEITTPKTINENERGTLVEIGNSIGFKSFIPTNMSPADQEFIDWYNEKEGNNSLISDTKGFLNSIKRTDAGYSLANELKDMVTEYENLTNLLTFNNNEPIKKARLLQINESLYRLNNGTQNRKFSQIVEAFNQESKFDYADKPEFKLLNIMASEVENVKFKLQSLAITQYNRDLQDRMDSIDITNNIISHYKDDVRQFENRLTEEKIYVKVSDFEKEIDKFNEQIENDTKEIEKSDKEQTKLINELKTNLIPKYTILKTELEKRQNEYNDAITKRDDLLKIAESEKENVIEDDTEIVKNMKQEKMKQEAINLASSYSEEIKKTQELLDKANKYHIQCANDQIDNKKRSNEIINKAFKEIDANVRKTLKVNEDHLESIASAILGFDNLEPLTVEKAKLLSTDKGRKALEKQDPNDGYIKAFKNYVTEYEKWHKKGTFFDRTPGATSFNGLMNSFISGNGETGIFEILNDSVKVVRDQCNATIKNIKENDPGYRKYLDTIKTRREFDAVQDKVVANADKRFNELKAKLEELEQKSLEEQNKKEEQIVEDVNEKEIVKDEIKVKTSLSEELAKEQEIRANKAKAMIDQIDPAIKACANVIYNKDLEVKSLKSKITNLKETVDLNKARVEKLKAYNNIAKRLNERKAALDETIRNTKSKGRTEALDTQVRGQIITKLDSFINRLDDGKGRHNDSESFRQLRTALTEAKNCEPEELQGKLDALQNRAMNYLRVKGEQKFVWGTKLRHLRLNLAQDIKAFSLASIDALNVSETSYTNEMREKENAFYNKDYNALKKASDIKIKNPNKKVKEQEVQEIQLGDHDNVLGNGGF